MTVTQVRQVASHGEVAVFACGTRAAPSLLLVAPDGAMTLLDGDAADALERDLDARTQVAQQQHREAVGAVELLNRLQGQREEAGDMDGAGAVFDAVQAVQRQESHAAVEAMTAWQEHRAVRGWLHPDPDEED